MDEPETHFNPDWKAKFIASIRHCFTGSKETMREMLITTHSPYLISDSDSKFVHVFEKDKETNQVNCYVPDFQTLGTSVNEITVHIFDKPNTIGDYAIDRLKELERKLEEGENPKTIIKELNKELGDSIEKTILINQILSQISEK